MERGPHRMDRGRSAETEILFLLARVAPRGDDFSAEWEYLENWLPQAREAMGDAWVQRESLRVTSRIYGRDSSLDSPGTGSSQFAASHSAHVH